MNYRAILARLLLTLMLTFQITSWAGVALADDSATPTPTPTDTASPSPDPSATPTPDPTATPSPSDSPDPSPSPSVSPSPSDSPSPSASPSPDVTTGAGTTGPDGPTGAPTCGGAIPEWVFNTTLTPQQWVPADQTSFTCDMSTGYYLSPKYYYNKKNGWYQVLSPAAVAALPADSSYITAPNVVHTVLGDLIVGSQDYQLANDLGLLGTGGIVVSGNSSASSMGGVATPSNLAGAAAGTQNYLDLTNLVNVINLIQSNAESGNVTANSNTQVGSAVTGAASVIANLINLLTSVWSWTAGNLTTFIDTILPGQTQTGDINLNLGATSTGAGGQLGASVSGPTGAGSSNSATVGDGSNLNVNAQSTGNITNNVDLGAQSGNATANANTVAGNVTSGTATAEVNIINLINSLINSGSSFFGILNIFGNLNGDILFPNGLLNGTVASGTNGATAGIGTTGADSTNQANVDASGQATINNSVANSINNNVATTAQSGSAGASSNTMVGGVGTGAATTTQSLFNLANTQIIGDNAVLVIVNVLGHWIGKIVSLPGGGSTTSALLTGNAQVSANVAGPTGANSTNTAGVNDANTVNANQAVNGNITNNVNVDAQSGNATASQNTVVGNVGTGNANAVSSVANIVNTAINVKHWFGVLVINVFGNWLGDVGDNTSAGDPASQPSSNPAPSGTHTAPVVVTTAVAAIVAAPAAALAAPLSAVTAGAGAVATGAADVPSQAAALVHSQNMSLIFVISAFALLLAGAMLSLERRLRRRG